MPTNNSNEQNKTNRLNQASNRTKRNQDKLDQTLQAKTLIYPDNLGDWTNGLGSYVLFNINTTTSSEFKEDGNASIEKLAIVGKDGKVEIDRPTQGSRGNRSNTSFLKGGTKRIQTSIMLYMPPTLQYSESVEWQNSDLGLIGRTTARGNSVADAFNSSGASGAISALIDDLKSEAPRTVASVVGALSGSDAAGAFGKFTGNILNPYTEVLFRGVANRQFQFQFKFAPKNEEEVYTVANILHQFRFHKAPEIEGPRLIYPSEFDISFYHIEENSAQAEENPFLPRISTCALTQVDTNFNESGFWAVYENGAPVEISLTLSFSELEIITKERILKGF